MFSEINEDKMQMESTMKWKILFLYLIIIIQNNINL